jgi:crotonobetainyl-CoA:carnitine CoA-transferase CaiB-like acyl-CoA transferase
MGPLDGVTVVEFGGFIAGPFAGQLLGDYGARVIKVEAPDGDPMRRWGAMVDGRGLWWHALARNKESIVLDLRDDADRAVARQLCAHADIVLENFAPGKMAEWGLDYASLAADNPGVILVHVSGFGQTGPRASDRGFGSIGEAMGGLRNLIGEPDRPPARVGTSLGDAIAALFAVSGALAALRERTHSGKGQEIDVALYEAVFALTESLVTDFAVAGVTRQRTGSSLPGVAPSNVYPTADGRETIIAANGDGLFRRLAQAMGQPQLADDPRFATHQARGANQVELDVLVTSWTRENTLDDLERILDEAQIPRGRVYTPADILADAHYAAREMVVRREVSDLAEAVPMTGIVPKYSRTPGGIRHTGPELDEHGPALRKALQDDSWPVPPGLPPRRKK